MDFRTTFDTRDFIEYIETLTEEIIDRYNAEKIQELGDDWLEIDSLRDIPQNMADYADELEDLKQLTSFASELACSPDYQYGETVIPEEEFTDYVRELVSDCGYLKDDLPWWINDAIDWEEVATNVKVDYHDAEYQGTTYYIRA